MTEYLIARTRDRSEWAMTESEGSRRSEIYRSADSKSMRVLARFEAPSWEDAKKFLDLLCSRKHTQTAFKRSLSWDEVRALLAGGELHARASE